MAASASTGSRSRSKWGFRVGAAAFPVLLLAVLELALRAVGYGYPTGFFLKNRVHGAEVLMQNEKATWRYFSPGLARSPQPLLIPAAKPPNTCRIFVLGESAAMGDPEPAFSFGRILEALLRDQCPGKQFEVVNAAITAINSHVVRDIARDCAPYQGDIWIIYMGNNEVVGPFGAGTVFGAQAPNLAFIRASSAARTVRVVQLLDAIKRRFHPEGPAEWEGMEMFLQQQVREDDPRMSKVYQHFEENLGDILRTASKCGAKVVLSTVASNLKDCSPFASLHRPDLTASQRAEWEKAYEAGIAAEQATNVAGALAHYDDAARVDNRHGELAFRRGRSQWALGRYAEAGRDFEQARDLDTLRFRADTRINQLIRKAAEGRERNGVKLFDADGLFASNSLHNIPGEEFFLEHVHFNFSGNYFLARRLAEQIETAWPGLVGFSTTNTRPLLSMEECARRLAFTDWDRYQVLDEMSKRQSQPPFTQQLDHARHYARLEEARVALQASVTGGKLRGSIEIYRQAVAAAPSDWVLHENFAKLLQASGDPKAAEEQWRKVIELMPHDEQAYYSLGNVLDGQGKSAEAVQYLRQALRRRPDSLEARNGLGLALASQGMTTEAMHEYNLALRRKPEFSEARVNLGQILADQGKIEEAKAQYAVALKFNSNSVAAHINLGKLLAKEKQWDAAIEQYEAALRAKPDSAVAHYNLGNALAGLGRTDEALGQFGEAVRCEPNFAEARHNLGLELAKRGRTAEAREQFTEALRLKPAFAEAHLNLGVALAKDRQFEQAIVHFQEALRLEPENAAAKRFLEQARAAGRDNTMHR